VSTLKNHALRALASWALVAGATLSPAAQQPIPPPATSAKPAPVLNDLDAFMAKVLERRNENWRTLHDYILSERETFEILGPADIPLHGLRREFQWFIRDGYLVRSPVKANGVTLSAADRKQYEDRWLEEEKKREADPEGSDKNTKKELTISVTGDAELSGFVGQGAEPRFISEAYFLKFRFEPGNYYFAGREHLDDREVVKIEYLPSRMFADEPHKEEPGTATSKEPAKEPDKARDKTPRKPPRKRDQKEIDDEEKIERAMNKTTTVTMWIDPQEYQVVRFTFDNVDWGFLPGRAIVRVDEAKASMSMGRVFEQVWLPREVTFRGSATFAAGTFRFGYAREFYDYRRGEVSAKIRAYVPKEPQP
jgi:hypothetical protein